MPIPEHKIQEVLDRLDIVSVVSRHVELKKAGREYKALCPFHSEKTPSFFVNPEKRRFFCLGCHVGGNALQFLQRYLGKGFLDTLKDVAQEVGVSLEGDEDPHARERRQLKEVHSLAETHFRARLADSTGGRAARDYLQKRGVTDETAQAFGLGWAPAEWSELSDSLAKQGVLEWALQAGLCQKRSRGDGYFDMFRGRLMIPVRSPDGRCIAFGGRLLVGEDGPKYLNSRESRLYNKSETLYGVDRARDEIRRKKSAILVEGYFDCIGLHQVGVRNVVALCSTALTPQHLELLSRMDAKEITLLLDGDDAGRKAVERLAGPLLARGVASRVATLPNGEDPDTFAQSAGAEGVQRLLEGAQPLTAHLFQTLLPGGRTAGFEEKMKGLERLKPVASHLPVGLTRSAFFGAVSGHFGLPAAELEAALRGKATVLRPAPKPAVSPPARRRPVDPLEAAFLACAFASPRLLHSDPLDLIDSFPHLGLSALLGQLREGTTPQAIWDEASDDLRTAIDAERRRLPRTPEELERYFAEISKRLKLSLIKKDLEEILRETAEDQGANDLSEEIQALQRKRDALLALKKKVSADGAPVTSGTKSIS